MARVTEEIHYGEYGVYGKEVVFSNGKSKLYLHVWRQDNLVFALAENCSAEELQHAIGKAADLFSAHKPGEQLGTCGAQVMKYSIDAERLQNLLFAYLQDKVPNAV